MLNSKLKSNVTTSFSNGFFSPKNQSEWNKVFPVWFTISQNTLVEACRGIFCNIFCIFCSVYVCMSVCVCCVQLHGRQSSSIKNCVFIYPENNCCWCLCVLFFFCLLFCVWRSSMIEMRFESSSIMITVRVIRFPCVAAK